MHHKPFFRAKGAAAFLAGAVFFLFLGLASAAFAVQIRILHVNDFHGYAEPYKPFGKGELLGGAAYLAGRVDALRADPDVPALLLAAGDMMQGHPWTNVNQGRAVIDLMNLMKFDAMVVGNHEFDFGRKVLAERMAQAAFPILGANVSGMAGLKPYVVKTVGGVRVGILGVVTGQTPFYTHPDNVRGLVFASPAEACRRYLGEVRRQSDVVILLSHAGFAEDRILAGQFPEIDIIIGGHSHTKVEHPVRIGKTVVVQAWEHAKALGVLDLSVEGGRVQQITGRLEAIRPGGDVNPAVAGLVARYSGELKGAMQAVVGKACRDLDGEKVRFVETTLGNMVADAMREATGADVALVNGGSIRTSIKQGPVSLQDIYSVLPFDNYAIVLHLPGRVVRQALEHGLGKMEEGSGAFLQVSGLRFSYDPAVPSGQRLGEVRVAGRPLDPDKTYAVALNDFMVAGGDGFVFLKELSGVPAGDNGPLVRDLVTAYIRARGEVCPGTEERIVPGGLTP